MRKIVLTLAMVIITGPAFAAGGVVTAHVDGMVCDFCARSLEKLFGKEEAVEAIKIDLDGKTVTINLKDGQELSDERIEEIVSYSGYDIEKIDRAE